VTGGTGPKARLFDVAGRIPIIKETADPWVFLELLVLAVAVGLGVAFPDAIFPGDEDARTHVLQVGAGALVLLGAYFTAVNIRQVRADQAFDRLHKVIDQLGSDSEAVRAGAIRLLQSILLEKMDLPSGTAGEAMAARRKAVENALAAAVAEAGGRPSTALAERVLNELRASGALP
jgi:hypothetical protein